MSIASLLFANTATRLMFTQIPYLLFGNLIIGVLEGLFIARVFKTKAKKTIPLMIVANYLSALTGFVLFGLGNVQGIFRELWQPNVINYPMWVAAAVAIAFLFSVLVEWPFCHSAFDKLTRPPLKSLRACIAAQTLSYLICLAPFSGLYGEIRIRDVVEIVPLSAIVSSDLPFRVYFIDPVDGDIYRMRVDGSSVEHYRTAELENHGRLAVYLPDAMIDPKSRFDLYARGNQGDYVIQESFASSESSFRKLSDPGRAAFNTLNSELAADLRKKENQDWKVRTRDWWGLNWARGEPDSDPWETILSGSDKSGLIFTTTFGTWQGRNASILPGDIVIFEFGGQICALDLKQRKLALIRMGYGPVVVRDEDESSD